MVRRAIVATGAVCVGGTLIPSAVEEAVSAPSPEQDVRILNFLLLLEYLQSALYAEAVAAGNLAGEMERFARVAGVHEREHLDALRRELGGRARAEPRLRFGDAVEREGRFVAASLTLEETAAAAYIGQAANLTRERTALVARIVSVEARHAAWLRDFAGRLPAPYAADRTRTPEAAMRTIDRTGFVVA